MKTRLIPALICLTLIHTAVLAADSPGQERVIRLFKAGGIEREAYTGRDWMGLDIHQKIGLAERARVGALEMDVVMTLPAEIYVAELDRTFIENPAVRHIEIGQAIKGIAISLQDWDDGTDPRMKLKQYMGESEDEG